MTRHPNEQETQYLRWLAGAESRVKFLTTLHQCGVPRDVAMQVATGKRGVALTEKEAQSFVRKAQKSGIASSAYQLSPLR